MRPPTRKATERGSLISFKPHSGREGDKEELLSEWETRANRNVYSGAQPELKCHTGRHVEHPAFSEAAAKELETLLGRHSGKMAQDSLRRLFASDKKRLDLFVVYLTEHGPELKRLFAER
jgi:hypothetical protein